MPSCSQRRLKRFSALSKDSPSLTLTAAINKFTPPLFYWIWMEPQHYTLNSNNCQDDTVAILHTKVAEEGISYKENSEPLNVFIGNSQCPHSEAKCKSSRPAPLYSTINKDTGYTPIYCHPFKGLTPRSHKYIKIITLSNHFPHNSKLS